MRRPTFCHNSVAAVEVAAQRQGAPHHTGAGPNAQGANQDKEETRLARMKRILTGSLLMGGGRRPPAGPPLKTFAVHLDDLPLTNEGLPRAVVRITNFIEKYGLQMEGLFRLSGGNPKLVEQLKASFDRTGDADLEGSGDVTSVAALLKLWIRDLPEPVVPAAGASELVALLQKYKGDTEDWCREVGRLLACDNASALLRERNARLLRCVLRLLHRYQLQQSAAHQQLHQSTAAAAAQQLAPVFAALLLSVDDGMPRIASPDTTALMFALIVNYARVYDESLSCNDVKMDGASTPETRLYSAGKNKSLNAPSLNNMSETTPLAYSGSKKQRKRKDRQSSADRMFVRSNSEERPCKSSCGGGLSVVSGGGSGGGGGAGGGFRRVSSHEDFSRSRANHAQKGAQLMELISETATSIQMSTPVTSSRGPLHERNQQFALRSSNSTTTTAKNNNLNKTTTTPSADYNQKLEYPNNNNNEALPWQPGDAVRRDDSLAVSVVCSPPADCQLMSGGTADEEEEREHERRRSSERFAPCGGGVMMMGGGRRRGGGGDSGERRRRKVARGGSSTPSRRRHRDARSPRRVCCSSSSEGGVGGGDSSSKENEEEEGQQQMSPRRHSTLMVVSPPPPISCHRGVPPPPATAASLSGEEDEREGEGGGSDGGLGEAGSMSRSSSTESEEGELGEPQHDPDEQQDEKEEGQERKEAVEEEVKGDVEELEEVEDDDEEVDEEGEGEEEDLNNDEPVLDLNRLHRNVDLSEPVPSRHDWSFAPQLPQPQQERLDDAESLRSSATFAAGHRAFEAAQAVSAAAAATPADQLPLSGRTHIAVIENHHAKQIHTLKKRLKRYEEGFEREFGYKPSSADKMANPDTKKMCQTLSKLRRELKQLKSESTLCASASMSQLLFLASGDHRVSVAGTPTKVINEEVVHDVEKRLNDKRSTARRPTVLEEMSREQLGDEKTAVQRALLQLESVYGRPATRDQRDLVRPLYDRYRQLKRLLARATANAKLKEGVAELGTILEHEQMDFSSSSPPPPSAPIAAPLVPPPAPAPTQRPTTPDYFDNLHALPRNELLDQHKTTREEKKRLRRQLHEFEDEMESKMGRKLQREDRQPMDAVYTQYKHIKAKLRLIEALITKK